MAALSWLLRLIGLRGSLVIAPPAALLALAVHAPARRALDRYWRRQRPGWSGAQRLSASLAHLASYLKVLGDRQLAYQEPCPLAFAFDGHGDRHLRAAVARGGCILLSAHIGNWELAGRLLSRLTERRTHLVLVPGEDQACLLYTSDAADE